MDEHEWLAERFEAHRARLRAVAYRMLGSLSEAEDAVQESWLHLSRSGTSGVENLGGSAFIKQRCAADELATSGCQDVPHCLNKTSGGSAMKKTTKKLCFTKESVRNLTAEELVNAAGGSGAACNLTTAPSCGGSCFEETCYC